MPDRLRPEEQLDAAAVQPHCTVRGTGCGLLNKGTQLIAYALDSEQVQRCVRLAKDINCNEYFAIPTSMAFEELEDLVEQYGD